MSVEEGILASSADSLFLIEILVARNRFELVRFGGLDVGLTLVDLPVQGMLVQVQLTRVRVNAGFLPQFQVGVVWILRGH